METLVVGLAVSAPLVLAAMGLTLICRVSGFINIACLEYLTLGGYLVYLISANMNYVPALALATLITGAMSVGFYRGFFRNLMIKKFHPLPLLIISVGLEFIILYSLSAIFTFQPRAVPFSAEPFLTIGKVALTDLQVASLVMIFLIMFLTHLMLSSTTMGRKMRAVGDDRILASIDGISSDKVNSYTWLIAGMYGGFAGALIATFSLVTPFLGFNNMIFLFAIVFLGGIGSVYGAMLAGIILVETKAVITFIASPIYGTVAAYIILVLIILFRPKGIMGG